MARIKGWSKVRDGDRVIYESTDAQDYRRYVIISKPRDGSDWDISVGRYDANQMRTIYDVYHTSRPTKEYALEHAIAYMRAHP